MNLRATFHSESPIEALIPIWERALMGLTEDEVRYGVDMALTEHKGEFMPTPAMVRAWGQGWVGPKAQEPPRPGGGQRDIDWWEAKNPSGGQDFLWHSGLKDENGEPIPKNAALEWRRLRNEKMARIGK